MMFDKVSKDHIIQGIKDFLKDLDPRQLMT